MSATAHKGTKRRQVQQFDALTRAMLQSALDCIITMDGAGVVREFNAAAERVFGFSRDEVIGRELAELIIPPRLREQHRRGLAHYLRTGEGPVLGKRIEITGLRKDGSEILVELAITPFKMDGTLLFTAFLRDITDQRRDELASRHLAAIVESSDDAVISTDLDGCITSWNSAAERIFGYSAGEVIGKSVTILIPADRHNEEPAILERIRRGERVEHYETVRRRKDGTLLDISVSFSPIKDEAGHVVGASKVARDITQRVQNDRRRTAQYTIASLLAGSESIAEIGPQIIQTIAASGSWVFGSIWLYHAQEEKLRCAVTWHTGARWLLAFEQATRATPLLNSVGLPGRVLQSRKAIWIPDVSRETNFPRRVVAAEAGICGAFGFPLGAEGTIEGVLELFSPEYVEPDEDLLKMVEAIGSQIGLFIRRRRTETELQQQKESAEAANAAKDRFLATLSHELRTPLTPVLIWAGGTVNQPELSADVREGLKMICRNVELEARLIDDLLDLTRLARGKLELQLRDADAHEVVQHALEIVRKDIEDRRLTVAISLTAASHIVRVDASRLQQVFWNVLRNACKYTNEYGAISVRSYNPAPDRIKIDISDSGVGIARENLEKIFDAFEQVDRRREGLGLGLAISKAIVEMHGGTVRAHSEGLGKGTTFCIELPLAPATR